MEGGAISEASDEDNEDESELEEREVGTLEDNARLSVVRCCGKCMSRNL